MFMGGAPWPSGEIPYLPDSEDARRSSIFSAKMLSRFRKRRKFLRLREGAGLRLTLPGRYDID